MYRDSTSGYWGFPTSTMDWCEENYAVTPYVAEFWNTISNVVFIVPPLTVAYHFWRYRLSEFGPIVCLLLLACVGFGSFAFHCTLLYESQLLDELPMIYGTCAMLYCIIEIQSQPNSRNTRLALLLTSISVLITTLYATFKNPLIFLWSYGLLAAVLLSLNIRGCIKYNGSKSLLLLATASYGFGFVLWNIDNELCYSVRDVRGALPGVIAPATQLHAWWHFFAGVGTFFTIICIVHLRIVCMGYNPGLKYLHNCFPFYVKGERINASKRESNNNINKTSSVKLKNRGNNSVGNFARLL